MSFINEAQLELERPEYIEDTNRIVQIAFKHGVILSQVLAERAWLLYSDSMAAGWMVLPKDDEEVWEIINL